MLQFITVGALLMALANGAPTPAAVQHLQQPATISSQQFLLLSPESQLHLQPTLKYSHQPLITPIVQLGRIETPKEQLMLFYPNAPLTQQPLVTFQRQEGGGFDIINFIQNWWNQQTGEKPSEGQGQQQQQQQQQSLSKPVSLAQQPAKIELFDSDAESIPATPANTIPMDNKRVYILTGQPQFYGNFDAFQNPLNPLFSLQPLAAVKARSSENSAVEAQVIDDSEKAKIQAEGLKISPDVEQQPLELVQEQVQIVGRSQIAELSLQNQLQEQSEMQIEIKENGDDTSVAQAKPSAIALAGPGGMASTQPIATALADKGGLAIASPKATSIAGDFLGDDEDYDKKKKDE